LAEQKSFKLEVQGSTPWGGTWKQMGNFIINVVSKTIRNLRPLCSPWSWPEAIIFWSYWLGILGFIVNEFTGLWVGLLFGVGLGCFVSFVVNCVKDLCPGLTFAKIIKAILWEILSWLYKWPIACVFWAIVIGYIAWASNGLSWVVGAILGIIFGGYVSLLANGFKQEWGHSGIIKIPGKRHYDEYLKLTPPREDEMLKRKKELKEISPKYN
jgi:hypothetical protein